MDKNRHGLARLQDLVRAAYLRRTTSGLGADALKPPPPECRIEPLNPGHDQELYTFFKKKTASIASRLNKGGARGTTVSTGKGQGDENILSLLNLLRLICDYGERMLPTTALEAWRERDMSSIDWQTMEKMHRRCASCESRMSKVDDMNLLPCGHNVCGKCQRRGDGVNEGDIDEVEACSACRDSDQLDKGKGNVGSSWSPKTQALIRNILTSNHL